MGACGQGAIFFNIPSFSGVNSVTSDPNDPDPSGTDWFLNDGTGTLTFEIYSAAYSSLVASESLAINSYAGSAATEQTAVNLLQADFTQQPFGTNLADEALTQNVIIDYGNTDAAQQKTYQVGTSATLTSGTKGFYGIIATYLDDGNIWDGALVLNASYSEYGDDGYQLGGGSNPLVSMINQWPDQNLFLVEVPEPTTNALAALGGISMLFFHRRKVQ